jgi:hypothetical protein
MNRFLGAASFLIAAVTGTAGVDPTLLNLVMPDAKVLSGIQVDQSTASPFGQYVLSQMQGNDDDFQKFIAATGFDPRRDLREIVAASAGTGSANGSNALILGRGVFQPARISAITSVSGGTVNQYRGFTLLTGRNSQGSLAFLDSSTVAMGSVDAVKGAIDRRLAGSVFSGPLVRKANDASTLNHAWFVTATPLSEFLNGKLANPNLNNVTQNNLLQSVQEASGGINFGASTVTITADAVTSSSQNAQALVDVLKFLVSLVQTNGATNPNAATLVNATNFSANGAIAHLTLSLPEQQAEQLFVPRNTRK